MPAIIVFEIVYLLFILVFGSKSYPSRFGVKCENKVCNTYSLVNVKLYYVRGCRFEYEFSISKNLSCRAICGQTNGRIGATACYRNYYDTSILCEIQLSRVRFQLVANISSRFANYRVNFLEKPTKNN